MKNVYLIALALFTSTAIFSQTDTLTFESYNLGSNSYYNGSDNNGSFTIGDYSLYNYYDTTYDFWNGYSISKVQDDVTVGLSNQYASFAAIGANASSQYAVYNYMGEIEFTSTRTLKSIQLTNTTYAAISMRDGDQFGKKFGDSTDANGVIDNTNGEDWFLLQIIPLNENDLLVGDTIDFYLADYRFADSTQDYIVKNWETVSLNDVVAKKLKFQLVSSDNSDWGMNTPNYFALDNLVTSVDLAHVKNPSELTFSIYPNPAKDVVTVQTNKRGNLVVRNASGQIMRQISFNGSQKIDLSGLSSGLYFFTIQTENEQQIQKLIIQ